MKHVSTIILGQGFAGTALAWSMLFRKTINAKEGPREDSHCSENDSASFAIIDRGDQSTCSYTAAGLVTPITGLRAVLTWGWEKAWPFACDFYSQIEQQTNAAFWYPGPSVRFFVSEEERLKVEPRFLSHPPELAIPYQRDSSLLGNSSEREWSERNHDTNWKSGKPPYHNRFGGVIMPASARLDASSYLNASRAYFEKANAYYPANLDTKSELHWTQNGISIPALGLSADRIVFCQGNEAIHDSLFSELPLVPARGDILTLRIPDLNESRVLHHGVWISRLKHDEDLYLVGSTYRWDVLHNVPNDADRQNILERLGKFLSCDWEVVDHRAGIRPTSFDRKPLIGQHQTIPQAWIFNGLGAKGSLLAPWCADSLVNQFSNPTAQRSNSLFQETFWNRRIQKVIDKEESLSEQRSEKFQAALVSNQQLIAEANTKGNSNNIEQQSDA